MMYDLLIVSVFFVRDRSVCDCRLSPKQRTCSLAFSNHNLGPKLSIQLATCHPNLATLTFLLISNVLHPQCCSCAAGRGVRFAVASDPWN